MSNWDFPGAKWWKFDFHTHTPESNDFMRGCTQEDKDQVTPEYWLQKFMEKEIDCVAVTDHNSGTWINRLKQALETLETTGSKPAWYRSLYLFPGIEISVNGGVHVLAVFGRMKQTSDIDSLSGAVGYGGTKGASDAETTKSLTEVVDLIVNADGIAIPAHVDKEKGLFKLQGTTLEQALNNTNIYAAELCDSDYQKPQLYQDKKLQWTEVKGSDTHNFRDNTFGTFTWIKMDKPSIEGLRLALLDGDASVNRAMSVDPNRHAGYVIEEITIKDARYMGRGNALACRFSPFLNAIIGGRGSGKSTLLEFMRFVLRREKEIPKALQQENEKYFNVGDKNLLTENSRISLTYRKEDARYRLNWSAKADIDSLQEERNGKWEAIQGEIRSLFPVHIYSQKQIFELAGNPRALLDIIDEATDVDCKTLDKARKVLVIQYKQNEQKIQELSEKINQKNRLSGEANDLARQIEHIEKSGHKTVLQNYRNRQQQLSEIRDLEDKWRGMSQELLKLKDDIVPARFNEEYFSQHPDIVSALKETNEEWRTIGKTLDGLAQAAQSVITDWSRKKDEWDWMQELNTDMERYRQVHTQLEQQGIDPDKYPLLLQREKITRQELQHIGEYQSRKESLDNEQKGIFEKIAQNRNTLSKKRGEFLSRVLDDNSSVNIQIRPFGEGWTSVEEDIRRILQCNDGRFEKDMENLRKIYDETDGNVNDKLEKLKIKITAIHAGEAEAQDKRFATHLSNLPQESISDLRLWFPGDDLEIAFGEQNRPLEQGSPGQKTAALLAFILSYGDEPLLLDQPEDDLDNELIYRLIVKQLRAEKSKRQIIVVTHNANIVVNGDAEMVLPLEVAKGQTRLPLSASIQDTCIRKRICDIMEGGQQAFKQRYKRIHLEV